MSEIVYLIGAGASTPALPLVPAIPAELNTFIDDLNLYILSGKFPSNPVGIDFTNHQNAATVLLKNCKQVAFNIQPGKFSTLDTYAKYLKLRNLSNEYYCLKKIISFLFLYIQLKGAFDNRYDTFFSSILRNNVTDFINEITILSWNYDLQFERAYGLYSGSEELGRNQGVLNLCNEGTRQPVVMKSFNVLKLNGTAAFLPERFDSKSLELFSEYKVYPSGVLMEKFVNYYDPQVKKNPTATPLINFAWEKDLTKLKPRDLLYEAKLALFDTKALVIIGYSFPFFNREVDRYVLEGCKKSGPNIYIQDLFPEKIMDRLKSVIPVIENRVKFVRDLDQFYLPPEI